MKDANLHSSTLFSVAGVEDTFSGRYLAREIINGILPSTLMIFAEAKRPHFYPSSISALIDVVAERIENLHLDNNLFSVSFDYRIRENNDELVPLLEEVWFEFEQPCFVFFQEDGGPLRKIQPDQPWTEIVELAPCYVMFKGAEDSVVWVGRSDEVDLNPGLILHEDR